MCMGAKNLLTANLSCTEQWGGLLNLCVRFELQNVNFGFGGGAKISMPNKQ